MQNFYGSSLGQARIVELLDRIDDEENIESFNAYIEPPDNATSVLTDEDSGDEEGETMNNLPGSILRTALIDSEDLSETQEPSTEPRRKKSKTKPKERNWKKQDIECKLLDWNNDDVNVCFDDLTPVQLFELFYDDELFDIIVEETNRYASQKNTVLGVTKDETKGVLTNLVIGLSLKISRHDVPNAI